MSTTGKANFPAKRGLPIPPPYEQPLSPEQEMQVANYTELLRYLQNRRVAGMATILGTVSSSVHMVIFFKDGDLLPVLIASFPS